MNLIIHSFIILAASGILIYKAWKLKKESLRLLKRREELQKENSKLIAEVVANEIAIELRRQGHNVWIVNSADPNNFPPDEALNHIAEKSWGKNQVDQKEGFYRTLEKCCFEDHHITQEQFNDICTILQKDGIIPAMRKHLNLHNR